VNELQESVVRGTYVRPSKLSVSEYLKDWLDTARLRLRPGAYDACELHVRAYITPRIGEVPLQALTSSKVKALYAELRQSGRARGGGPLSAKTVHNIHRTLSRALGDAVTDRLIASNPAAGQHRQPESPEMPTWSAEQLRGFLHFVADDPYAALWRLAATTGLRRGELAGLRWRDVDFDAGRVVVAQQRAKGGGAVEAGPTKTRRSRRLVSLDERTLEALREHRNEQLEIRLMLGPAFQDHDLVFCLTDGRPLHPDRLTQMFRDRCDASGLPYITLHGLRHSHASQMLRAGVHPKVVQERLGHSSISITLDTYSHAIPAMQEDAAERAAALIDTPDDERGEEQG
jgi:integrase